MIKLFTSLKYYFIYKRAIKKGEEYLQSKYGLNRDIYNRLWTVIDIKDANDQLKKYYGNGLLEKEVKNYISNFKKDLSKLDLQELVKVYEIKKINDTNCGITLGYSLINSKVLILRTITISTVALVLSIIALVIFL